MNENVVDILIYLYENYMDSDPDSSISDQSVIEDELLQAGFTEQEVDRAFQWMDGLIAGQSQATLPLYAENAMRIYTPEELDRLDQDSRGLLLFLEQNGILNHASRELVIDRALALGPNPVGVEELKWVVLMVLINQPGQEMAFAQMEDLVYNDIPAYLH